MLTLKEMKQASIDRKTKSHSSLGTFEKSLQSVDAYVEESTKRFDRKPRKTRGHVTSPPQSHGSQNTPQYHKKSVMVKKERPIMKKETYISQKSPKITDDRFSFADKVLQSNIMSKHAQNAVSKGKSKIIGMIGCGACKLQKHIIDGKVRIVKFNDKGELGYDFVDINDAQNILQDQLAKNKELYTKKGFFGRISEKDYQDNEKAIQHFIQNTDMIVKHKDDYVKSGQNYEMLYINDITENDVKPFKKVLQHFENEKNQLEQEKVKLFQKLQQKKIDDQSFILKINGLNRQITQTQDILLDQIYKSKSEGAQKVYKYLIANEISSVYGLTAYPMRIQRKCEIDPEKQKVLSTQLLLGENEGVLSVCQDTGAKEGMDFLTWTAKQNNDTKLLQSLTEQQKEKMSPIVNKKADVYNIHDLIELYAKK